MKRKISIIFAGLSSFFIPFLASAHEVYVLSQADVKQDFTKSAWNPFISLMHNPGNVKTFVIITAAVTLAAIINFFFRHSRWGRRISEYLGRFENFGSFLVRLALSLSFLFSAYFNVFLGPELPLSGFPHGDFMRILLYISGTLIFLGLWTEYASVVGLLLFIAASFSKGLYMFTYVGYLGEIIALILFGSRFVSLDKLLFGRKLFLIQFKKFEPAILRVCYGASLLFAAVNIKLLHPALTLQVVEQYHLTRFHLLFPADPYLVVLGAALAEIAIALCIIFSFEVRFATLISLFYITLSLLFFKESVWPHFIMYGVSFYILLSPQVLSIDRLVDKILRRG